jgi:hypothetical protein
MHGQGKLWTSHTIYEGSFVNDQLDGDNCTMTSKKDGVTFRGTWKNGKLNGQGKKEWPDGRFYEGHFVDGRIFGPGIA